MGAVGVPGWLVFVGSTAVALVFAVGLVVMLVMQIPVPQELWVLVGVIATAYFGSGPFSVAHQGITTTNKALIDTVNHSIATLHTAIGSINTSGSAMATGTDTTTPTEPAA